MKYRRSPLKRYDLLAHLSALMKGMRDEDIMGVYVIAMCFNDCVIELPGKKPVIIENRRITGTGVR